MLACSAAWNTLYWTKWAKVLNCLDRSMIFVMIAGSYTPFVAIILERWEHHLRMLVFVWTVAAIGIAFTIFSALTCKGRPERQAQEKIANLVANIAYLSLGWCAVGIWTPVTSFAEPETIQLFVRGGVLYSVGFVFFASPWLPYNTAIWHVFVLAAAASHLQGVLHGLAHSESQVSRVALALGAST